MSLLIARDCQGPDRPAGSVRSFFSRVASVYFLFLADVLRSLALSPFCTETCTYSASTARALASFFQVFRSCILDSIRPAFHSRNAKQYVACLHSALASRVSPLGTRIEHLVQIRSLNRALIFCGPIVREKPTHEVQVRLVCWLQFR